MVHHATRAGAMAVVTINVLIMVEINFIIDPRKCVAFLLG